MLCYLLLHYYLKLLNRVTAIFAETFKMASVLVGKKLEWVIFLWRDTNCHHQTNKYLPTTIIWTFLKFDSRFDSGQLTSKFTHPAWRSPLQSFCFELATAHVQQPIWLKFSQKVSATEATLVISILLRNPIYSRAAFYSRAAQRPACELKTVKCIWRLRVG